MNFETVKDEVQFMLSEDCPFERRHRFISALSTAAFWFILMIFLAVSPGIKKEKKYKEVQIVLSDEQPKKIQKKETSAPPAPSAAPEAVSEAPAVEQPLPPPPAPAKKTETPVKKTEAPKPAPKKETQPKPAAKPAPAKTPATKPEPAPAPVEYAVDPMEAFNNQTSQKKTQSFDWSQFNDDTPSNTSNSSSNENYVSSQSSIAGTAATGTSTQNQKVTSQNSSSNSTAKTAASSTSNALGKIANTAFVGNSSSTVKSQANIDAVKGSNGKVTIKMSDGSSRALLEPSSPVINLSDEASSLIDSTKNVQIEFQVVASGNVPFSKISITPQSILPALVRAEIIEQISTWRFETAATSSTAIFDYTIIKR